MSHLNFAKLFNLMCNGIRDFENMPIKTYLPQIVEAILDLRHQKEKFLFFVDLHVSGEPQRAEIEQILKKIANDENNRISASR